MSSADTSEDDNNQRKDACYGLRQELIDCIQKSECYNKYELEFKDCLKPGAPGMDADCSQIRYAFFQCKRSLLDMRQRFRGKKGY